MKRYNVGITGRIYVVAEIDVEAENEEQAQALAMEKAFELEDGADWEQYTAVPDSETLQVEDVTEIE
jgi:hypothetical protein